MDHVLIGNTCEGPPNELDTLLEFPLISGLIKKTKKEYWVDTF